MSILQKLAKSNDACLRFKALSVLCNEETDLKAIQQVQQMIPESERVRLLLSERQYDGCIPFHPYAKWYGAHWVLVALADLGYPVGDKRLIPLREQVYHWLLSESHQKNIRTIAGRVRRCASYEGNALYSLLTLGLSDDRTEELANRLQQWQWPDGGWNCDKRPEAYNSSFMESLIPLRALALHARLNGNIRSKEASTRAAEIFLKRHLFKKQRDGKIMRNNFIKLHYPCYWHYDILFGLKVMAETGFIGDPRCNEALDLLESKRLPDGGFPAEAKYYNVTSDLKRRRSLTDWGVSGTKRMNEFVTLDAMFVLKAAGRMKV